MAPSFSFCLIGDALENGALPGASNRSSLSVDVSKSVPLPSQAVFAVVRSPRRREQEGDQSMASSGVAVL